MKKSDRFDGKYMNKATPIQHEISFGLDEMFFSTTDHKGVILDGNDVFVKISQYTRDEIIGAPHNIIRHPDMPKIVFKTLWNTILSGQSICAYVKNMAKDGSYYWVFATVIPFGENFLSIRMKPTTSLKGIVEGLYKELIDIEKNAGVDASLKALVEALNSLGFADYQAFGLAAIGAELTNRYELNSLNSNDQQVLKLIKNKNAIVNTSHLEETQRSLFKIFLIINKLSTYSSTIGEKISKIEVVSKNIEFSGVNTIIEAERLGNTGRALSVVAEHISNGAVAAKKLNMNVSELANEMLGGLGEFRSIQLSIALSTLQIEMLSCFAKEWSSGTSAMSEENFRENSEIILSLIKKSLEDAKPILKSLRTNTEKFSTELEHTSEVLKTLNFIQKTGSIESARLLNGSIFSQLFLEIANQIKVSKELYDEFAQLISEIIHREIVEANGEYEKAFRNSDSILL